MSEPKFTPGPWDLAQAAGGFSTIASTSPRFVVALSTASSPAGTDEREANAHLVASAPDLYTALENALVQLMEATKLLDSECTNEMAEAWRNGVSALAKARGEQ